MAKKQPQTTDAPVTDAPSSDTASIADAAGADIMAADLPALDADAADDEVMPEAGGRTDAAALNLLFDACEKYNINPALAHRPRELAAWRYYPANRVEGTAAAVVLVTAGGLKIRHAAEGVMDVETEERLRMIFRAVKVDPTTKNLVPTPLPGDLSLPAEAVIGVSTSQTHRHPGGYLRRARP